MQPDPQQPLPETQDAAGLEPAIQDPPAPRPAQPQKCNLHATKRRRKEALLPIITQLVLEGHSGQAIAMQLDLPKRTVNHWLQKLRQEWLVRVNDGATAAFALTLLRYEMAFREAMEAWRHSRADQVVRLRERARSGEGEATQKQAVRSETQSGKAAFLAQALAALKAISKLKGLDQYQTAEPLAIDMEKITVDAIRRMTGAQIDALEKRCIAHGARKNKMTEEEYRVEWEAGKHQSADNRHDENRGQNA